MDPQRVNLNIPVAHFQEVLSWDGTTIDRLVSAACEVARRVGLRLDDDVRGTYLKEVEKRGAKVHWGTRAVSFSEADIDETIEVMRKSSPTSKPLRPLSISSGREERFGVGNGANLLFDWEDWQVKAPTSADFVELCCWAEGSDTIKSLFPPVLLKDVDQRLAPILSYALIGRHCRKKVYHEQPTEPIHVRYLDRMARVVEAHRGYFQPMQDMEWVSPPFRMSLRSIETMLARVDLGACDVMGVGTMTVSGMSAPVTVAGLAVSALGEILAGLTLFRMLRPGFGLRPNVCSGNLDLRTSRVSYFGMRTHLQNLATWELLVRGIGVESNCLTWYRDANEPGMQALYEFGMAQAFFSSVLSRSWPEVGGLACGNVFSPEQAVLDMELIREFNELTWGFEVTEEALGIQEIVEGSFNQVHIASDHTLRYMQDGVPFSGFLFRGLPGGAGHDRNRTQTHELIEKARETVLAATRKGRDRGPDVELGGELYEHVRKAAKEMGIEAPELI